MALRRRVWSAGKALVIAGALVATYLVFAVASMRVALRAREVTVPNFVSHTSSEASAMAADVGLTIRVDDSRRQDPKMPAGHVLGQDPPAGSTARPQRSVRVWLSAGPHAAEVPSVVGQTERAAQLRLTQDGLTIANISEIRNPAYPADVVVAQNPPAKGVGAEVSLLVNRAGASVNYVMPDLIGVNGDRAAEVLRGQGFRVAVVGSTPYPGIAPGIVVRQSPQGGFQIAPGDPISLEVSR